MQAVYPLWWPGLTRPANTTHNRLTHSAWLIRKVFLGFDDREAYHNFPIAILINLYRCHYIVTERLNEACLVIRTNI